MAKISKDFISHLEFLGYEIEPQEEDSILAKHQRLGNFFMKPYLDGILIQSYFRINDKAKKKRSDFLEAINSLNSGANVVTYVSVGNDPIVLRMDCIYLGVYDKKKFGLFLEAYNIDSYDRIVDHESMKNFVV